jgi:hypothetical protein
MAYGPIHHVSLDSASGQLCNQAGNGIRNYENMENRRIREKLHNKPDDLVKKKHDSFIQFVFRSG